MKLKLSISFGYYLSQMLTCKSYIDQKSFQNFKILFVSAFVQIEYDPTKCSEFEFEAIKMTDAECKDQAFDKFNSRLAKSKLAS